MSETASGAARRWGHAPVITRRTSAALLLLPLESLDDDPLMLSGTAIVIWEAFNPPATVDDVVASLGTRFSGPAQQVTRDVATTVDTLVSAGALEERE